MNNVMLKTENLTLGYDGVAVISDLNITVKSGDYLFVVGENGGGKSTFIKTVLGLTSKLSGKIEYGFNKNEIGYLPQQTAAQKDFPASCFEVVLSGFCGKNGIKPFYTKFQKQKALENIEKMGITALTKRCFRELSGGQQQRVLLARALCASENILLLDEPTQGLDPKATLQMYDLIEKLNREGLTVIEVSHDIGAALKYASHILHIGSEVFFGTTENYKNSAEGSTFIAGGAK